MSRDDDQEIILALSIGSQADRERMYQLIGSRINSYLTGMRHRRMTPEVREELVQETLVRVFRSFRSWKPTASFWTWLRTLTRNVFLDFVRRSKVRREGRHESLDHGISDDEAPNLHERIPDLGSMHDDAALDAALLVRRERRSGASAQTQEKIGYILKCRAQGWTWEQIYKSEYGKEISMLRGADVAAFLRRVREAVATKRVRASDYARDRAREDLGWDIFDIGEQLRELTEKDLYRREPSHDRPWEEIWTFTPPLLDEEGFLWIRIVERDGVLVVSFHRG